MTCRAVARLGTRCAWIVASAMAIGALSWAAVGQGSIVSQGVEAIRAHEWQAAGYDGTGVKVAIWDSGFYGYKQLLGRELPPANRITVKAIGMPITGPDDDLDGAKHGTAVAEIVYDIAPGADFYLVAASEEEGMLELLDWLIEQQVDVVVASLGFQHWCVPSGANQFEPVFGRLREAGILLVAASGNEGLSHWQGDFTDADNDSIHEFPSGDEWIEVYLHADQPIELEMQWDDNPCQGTTNDYVLKLTDWEDNVIFESDYDNTVDGPYEDIYDVAPFEGYYYIVIEEWYTERDATIDLTWQNGPEFDGGMRYGSVATNHPGVSEHVMTVGAVNWRTFKIESTSSGGPTKDGRIKPDIVAPTCVITASYGGRTSESSEGECGFEGTSAATPHVGGAAVLVKQAFPDFDANEIQDYLEDHAVEMGTAGKDNIYGSGRLRLPSPP